MAQFTITLPDELESEVREMVKSGKYGSISDFIRDAIKSELSYKPRYWERFISVLALENNLLLRSLVDNDEEITRSELLDGLRRGYTSSYHLAEYKVAPDELTRDDADFVMSVLEMYGELQRAAEIHGLSEEIKEDALFEGFDGNAGDGYLGYVNFLVDNGRFTHIKPLDKTPHLNSHHSVNEVYSRMLEEYRRIKSMKERFEYEPLNAEEVKLILDASIHPSNR